MSNAMTAVRFDHVDVVFGLRAPEAITLLDQGQGRDAILDKTNCLIAVHDA
jgi:glycine betaine/proline transport system ATP-binding protein